MSAVSALALFSCSSEEVVQDLETKNTDEVEEPVTPVEWKLTAAESRAADNMSGFNFDFFKAVCLTSGENENVLASPLSAQILLAMVANTTDGAERAEIVSALGEENLDALNSLCAKYIAGMQFCNDDARMSLVNALWYSDVYTLNLSFAATLGEYFHTAAKACDFQASEAFIARINSWCDKSTNGLIPELLD